MNVLCVNRGKKCAFRKVAFIVGKILIVLVVLSSILQSCEEDDSFPIDELKYDVVSEPTTNMFELYS